jgi:hypothetical protein
VKLLGRRILALSIFFVLMAAGAFTVARLFSTWRTDAPKSHQEQAPQQIDMLGATEIFMPRTQAGGHFFVSASDTRTLSYLLSRVAESASRTAARDLPGMADSPDMLERAGLLVYLGDFIGAADEMTVYSPFDGGNRTYAAFAVDSAKLDALMSGAPERRFRVADRPDERPGGDSWTLETPGGSSLYAMRRRLGERSLLCASNSEEGLREMERAAADTSARFSPQRKTEGQNHVSINFAAPVLGRGFSLREAEASWNTDSEGIRVRYFTDLSTLGANVPQKSDFIPETVGLFGEGRPVLFATVDPAYLLRTAYPDAADPVKTALESIKARLTPVIFSDIEAILKNCRLSAAVVAKGGSIDAAYVILDTDELEALGKIFSFSGMFLTKTAGPDGWETYNLPMKNGRAFAARMGRFAMLGLGDARVYAARRELPDDIAGMFDASCGAGFFASSELLSLRAPGIGKTLDDVLAERRPGDSEGWAALAASLKNMERISVTHSTNGRGDINITFLPDAGGR